jgi:5-formyltetrahydrofolate cyclo-ligase
MRALRLIADQKHGPEAARALIDHLLPRLAEVGMSPGVVVAGYWPIATEIDVRPLMARLIARGIAGALPVLVAEDAALAFRAWQPADDLDDGPRGTRQPPVTAPLVRPGVVLVPTLAFDPAGHRLGQGGGYYDRTLAALRRDGPVTAIGVAYALQRRESLPHDERDQPLDWILTEEALVEVPR